MKSLLRAHLSNSCINLSACIAASTTALFTLVLFAGTPYAAAQSVLAQTSDAKSVLCKDLISARSSLPDEPLPAIRSAEVGHSGPASPHSSVTTSAPDDSSGNRSPRIAPVYHRYIESFETAQHLTQSQSMIFGFHQSISPYFLLTILAASGYEQARNSGPNYGTNIGSYGERLGAAAIRDTSQAVFSDSLMAPLLHQDPRYYIMGSRNKPLRRIAYSISRVVVTKSSDDGRLMPNYSQVAGYAEAAALTNAYYPDVNVGFEQTAKSLGGSLLGLSISNVVREFLPDILRTAHLQRFE